MSQELKKIDYSALQQCMHCGMCLPTCPTYAATLLEKHSPRGRISLMRAVADDRLEISASFGEEMSFCLGCLACETACPAAVDYTLLFESARADIEQSGVLAHPVRQTVRRLTLGGLFLHPRLLRWVGHLLGLYQRSGLQRLLRQSGFFRIWPRKFQTWEKLAPPIQARFSDRLIAPVERCRQTCYRVALLTGCLQDLIFSQVNRDTAAVLVRNGCEVHTPPLQFCCGSLHAHNGATDLARTLARRNLDLIPPARFDAIISNSAGCGSHLKHYDRLLADDPRYASAAEEWSKKVRDIHEWLAEIGWESPGPSPNSSPQPGLPVPVTYHDACHLCHGQKITASPRQILASLPGHSLVDLPESTWCCGSAGIYNLTQPEMALQLRARKVQHILGTGARIVATANPGCMLQLMNGLPPGKDAVRVAHPITLLAEAYAREQQI